MKGNNDYKESRKHIRAKMHNIVVGILNSNEPETIGTIADISLGGVKFAYLHRMKFNKRSPVQSIDLIAGSLYLLEIPCKYVWDGEVERVFHTKSAMVRQCGIQFGKLTPKQTFLVNKFIDICVSEGIKSLTQRTRINIREGQHSYRFF
jgi:hypothetical protein